MPRLFLVVSVADRKRRAPFSLLGALEGPLPPLDSDCDGCTAVPDRWRNVAFWPACWFHDWAYSLACPARLSRREADAAFRRNLRACGRAGRLPLLLREAVAWVYWLGVRTIAWRRWKKR